MYKKLSLIFILSFSSIIYADQDFFDEYFNNQTVTAFTGGTGGTCSGLCYLYTSLSNNIKNGNVTFDEKTTGFSGTQEDAAKLFMKAASGEKVHFKGLANMNDIKSVPAYSTAFAHVSADVQDRPWKFFKDYKTYVKDFYSKEPANKINERIIEQVKNHDFEKNGDLNLFMTDRAQAHAMVLKGYEIDEKTGEMKLNIVENQGSMVDFKNSFVIDLKTNKFVSRDLHDKKDGSKVGSYDSLTGAMDFSSLDKYFMSVQTPVKYDQVKEKNESKREAQSGTFNDFAGSDKIANSNNASKSNTMSK